MGRRHSWMAMGMGIGIGIGTLLVLGCGSSSSSDDVPGAVYNISGGLMYAGTGPANINLPAPFGTARAWKTAQVTNGATITISGNTKYSGQLEPTATYQFGVQAASGSPVMFVIQGTSTPTSSFGTGNLSHTGGNTTPVTTVVATVQGSGAIEYGGWLNIVSVRNNPNLEFDFNVNYAVN